MSRTLPARFRTSPRPRNKRLTFRFESRPNVRSVVSRLLVLVRRSWMASELGLLEFFRRNFLTLRLDLRILLMSNDIVSGNCPLKPRGNNRSFWTRLTNEHLAL